MSQVCAELNSAVLHSLPLRYDIKGCEVSRWVDPAPEGSPIVLVLKDLNFEGKTINLGEPRSGHCLLFLHSG